MTPLYILLFFILLIIVICAAPLKYKIEAGTGSDKYAAVNARWLFGIVGFYFNNREGPSETAVFIFGRRLKQKNAGRSARTAKRRTERERRGEKRKTSKSKKPRGGEKKQKNNALAEIIRMPDKKGILDQTVKFIKRMYRAAKPEYFVLTGEAGFGSPELTGWLFAGIGVLSGLKRADIGLTGNFQNEVFAVELKAGGAVSIAGLCYPFVRLAFSRPVFKLIMITLRGRG